MHVNGSELQGKDPEGDETVLSAMDMGIKRGGFVTKITRPTHHGSQRNRREVKMG
jgi:hypothetical protein